MTAAVVFEGDCLEVMRGLADCSIDSIVTDPPYELGFMGKSWDASGVAFRVEVWREALRVLKPGGHLLAFSGSRTYHRMACAIEDAGFEIRDQIMWVYSQGFPKSLNLGCKCTGGTLPYDHGKNSKPQAERDMYSLRDSNVSTALDSCERGREVLQQGMPQQGPSTQGRKELSGSEVRIRQSGLEGRSDILEKTRKLQAGEVCQMPEGVYDDGQEGRLCHGASFDHGKDDREVSYQRRSGASHQPRSARQQAGKPRAIPEQLGSQEGGGGACEVCGGLGRWNGWGTALKPAHEPIVVARKPLIGTVAVNVLAHGTGAMNIDGCRVETDDVLSFGSRELGDGIKYGKCKPTTEGIQNPAGRWPANLIHDGSEEVEGFFPGDDGESAARFFYSAKASKRDREEGLRAEGRANIHPTVKPTDLMRYLCRLVTPPGGMILDPFTGSGSTGKGAVLEGFRFMGIELSPEYAEIARARIRHALGPVAPDPVELRPEAPAPLAGQLKLFA